MLRATLITFVSGFAWTSYVVMPAPQPRVERVQIVEERARPASFRNGPDAWPVRWVYRQTVTVTYSATPVPLGANPDWLDTHAWRSPYSPYPSGSGGYYPPEARATRGARPMLDPNMSARIGQMQMRRGARLASVPTADRAGDGYFGYF
jgi:hypothetical protein